MKSARGLLFLAGMLLAIAGCHTGKGSYYIPLIEKTANLLLPPSIAVISEFDAGELEVGGKYRLSASDIEPFLKSLPFHVLDEAFTTQSRYNFFSPVDKIPIDRCDSIWYYTGNSKGNSWIFTLDKNMGYLWIEVRYAPIVS